MGTLENVISLKLYKFYILTHAFISKELPVIPCYCSKLTSQSLARGQGNYVSPKCSTFSRLLGKFYYDFNDIFYTFALYVWFNPVETEGKTMLTEKIEVSMCPSISISYQVIRSPAKCRKLINVPPFNIPSGYKTLTLYRLRSRNIPSRNTNTELGQP